jgi:uncharacterized Zn finger protein/DNA-binding transcriptional regulator YiaG
MAFYDWRPYVSVAARRNKARKEMEKLRKKGVEIQPVELTGRAIARSFWGKGWCDHLESFSDFENRLPRGRTYVRNGSVCHLEIQAGRVEAFVSGSALYKVAIEIEPLAAAGWKAVKEKCRGQIGSMLELLQGRLSDNVMAVVSDRHSGLFPQPGEIKLDCSCPDWATMCKHVAAALYGVGSLLDSRPELLFILRGVDASELIAAEVALPAGVGSTEGALAAQGLSAIFGIDLEDAPVAQGPAPAQASSSSPRRRSTVPPAPMPGKSARKPASKPTGKTALKVGAKIGKNANKNANGKNGPRLYEKSEKKPAAKKAPKITAKTPTRKIPPKSIADILPPHLAKAYLEATRQFTQKAIALAKSPKAAARKSKPANKPVAQRAAQRAPRPRLNPVFNPDAPTGAAIARLRAQAGLSELQFARALGVSTATVQRWETATGSLRLYARPLDALARLQEKLSSR